MSKWSMVKLGDVCLPIQSITANYFKDNDEFNYIDIASVDKDLKRITGALCVDSSDAPSRARQLVALDDVLVSTVRPNLNSVAIVNDEKNGAIASTGFCVLRSIQEKLLPRYLFSFVKTSSFIDYLTNRATGASYPAVSDKIIKACSIPLPPLPEQKRIVELLDRAQGLIDARKEQIALMDSLVQSLFYEMFGDPVKNDKGWDKITLDECCDAINDCPHSTPEWSKSGKICLRTSNLGKGVFNWDDKRYVSEETYMDRSSRGILKADDIVLSREGTIGIAAIIPSNVEMCMGQRLVQVRPNSKIFSSHYLLHQLLFILSPFQITNFMVGSTSQHLNVKELRLLKIPVPLLAIQQTFAEKVQKIEAIKNTMTASLEELEQNFNALMQQSFG